MAYTENEPEYPLHLVKDPHYPEQSSKISPFDVQGIKLPVSKADILEAIQKVGQDSHNMKTHQQ